MNQCMEATHSVQLVYSIMLYVTDSSLSGFIVPIRAILPDVTGDTLGMMLADMFPSPGPIAFQRGLRNANHLDIAS